MKKVLRTIYVYTTETYGSKRKVRGRWVTAFVKIGETTRDANVRIDEQDTTAVVEPLVRVRNSNGEVLEFQTYLTDDEIREALFDKGYFPARKDKKREWVAGFVDAFEYGDEIEIAINEVIMESGKDTRKVYDPYVYKVYIKNLFLAILDLNLKLGNLLIDFALELAPRFGKTTWMIDLLITLFDSYGYRLCVLPSYWLSSHSSFYKDLVGYKGFTDKIHYVKLTEGVELKNEIDKWYGKKLIVVELSLHQKDMEVFDMRLKDVIELPSREKLCMIDEADFGVPHPKQMQKIESLGCSLNCYLSGSGLEKITAPLKNIGNNIIQWSYTDMLLMKEGRHPLFFD